MPKDKIELTPENFCYLSNCKYFVSNVESTGCRLDYMKDNQKEVVDKICPLAMEREFRCDDPKWNPCRDKVTQKLREMTESFMQDKKIMERIGRESYFEALERYSLLAQKAYDAKIKYEKIQYKLQEVESSFFGEEVEEEKR